MKRLSYVLMLLVVAASAVSLSGCNRKLAKLKTEIQEAQKQMPVDMGSMGTFTSIELDEQNNEVIFSYMMNPELVNPEIYRNHTDMLKKNMMYQTDIDGGSSDILRECADAGVAMTLKFAFPNGSSPIKVTITPEEVNKMTHMTAKEARMAYLQNQVDMSRLELPMATDDITIWADMKLENNYIVYIYKIDESQYTIDEYKPIESQLRQNLKASLTSEKEPALQEMLKICKQANVGISYKYIGQTTGQTLVFTFESSEL